MPSTPLFQYAAELARAEAARHLDRHDLALAIADAAARNVYRHCDWGWQDESRGYHLRDRIAVLVERVLAERGDAPNLAQVISESVGDSLYDDLAGAAIYNALADAVVEVLERQS